MRPPQAQFSCARGLNLNAAIEKHRRFSPACQPGVSTLRLRLLHMAQRLLHQIGASPGPVGPFR